MRDNPQAQPEEEGLERMRKKQRWRQLVRLREVRAEKYEGAGIDPVRRHVDVSKLFLPKVHYYMPAAQKI